MAVSENVTQLALILQEAGFVAIAGEILTEIDRGRIEQRLDALDEADPDLVLVYVPYEEDEQFEAAIQMMRRKLVAPARAFAEAEQRASAVVGKQTEIRFVDPRGEFKYAPDGRGPIGDASLADKLDAFLVDLLRPQPIRLDG